MRILILDSNEIRSANLGRAFRHSGAIVHCCTDMEMAGYMLQDYAIDVAIHMLDTTDNELAKNLREMRHFARATSILAIVGRDDPTLRVRALDAGADQAVSRPCAREEIREHAFALYRRALGHASNSVEVGPVSLDVDGWNIRFAGRPVNMANRSLHILRILALNAGQRLSRDELASYIYGPDDEYGTKIFDVYICKIRRHLIEKFADVPIRIGTESNRGWSLRFDMSEKQARDIAKGIAPKQGRKVARQKQMPLAA